MDEWRELWQLDWIGWRFFSSDGRDDGGPSLTKRAENLLLLFVSVSVCVAAVRKTGRRERHSEKECVQSGGGLGVEWSNCCSSPSSLWAGGGQAGTSSSRSSV